MRGAGGCRQPKVKLRHKFYRGVCGSTACVKAPNISTKSMPAQDTSESSHPALPAPNISTKSMPAQDTSESSHPALPAPNISTKSMPAQDTSESIKKRKQSMWD